MLELDDYVRAYAGASVAVNIHREGNHNGGTATGCNQRLFELAAIGVPQVVDNRADLSLAFDPAATCSPSAPAQNCGCWCSN